MQPNIPGSGQDARLSYEIITAYGVYKPDIAEELSMRVPRADSLGWLRKLAGAGQKSRMVPKRIARNKVVSHYEERDHLNFSATIAVVDNGTPNETTITLSAADHFDSGANSLPKVSDLVVFTNEAIGYVSAIVKTTPSAHEVTILEQNSSQDVQAASVVGNKVVFFSNEQGAASKKRGSHVPGYDKFDFTVTTTREDIVVDDFEMQNATWFKHKGSHKVYVKALDEFADKFNMKEQLKLLIGEASESLTSPEGNPLYSSTQLIPQITNAGINFDYYGSPDLTTLENLELLNDRYYGDTENLIACGINADQGWRQWLIEFTEGGGRDLSFAGFNKQDIGINVKSIQLGSYTFHIDCWRILSHAGTLGVDGMPYRDMILQIPLGSGNAYVESDGEMQRQKRDYFRCVYAPLKAGNRIVDDVYTWDYGALAQNHSDDELALSVSMASYKTLELLCLNKFGIARKVG
jgi:hypothetical protein